MSKEKLFRKGLIKIKICDPLAPILVNSLKAEISQPQPQKGNVNIKVENECLIVEISSNSISGLRALTNSFLYLIHAAISSLRSVEKFK